MYNIDGCKIFLGVIKTLCKSHWQWLYHALILLGAIVLSAETSFIRKMALEEGLLVYISYDDPSNSFAWTCRAACAVCLNYIYAKKKNNAVGLLAQAALIARIDHEPHAYAKQQLNLTPPEINRLSIFFKYAGRQLAENYNNTQSDIMAMRKYIKTAERSSKKKENFKVPKANILELQKELKLEPLSIEPYHRNYKKPNFGELKPQTPLIRTQPSTLFTQQTKYSCIKEKSNLHPIDLGKPSPGTANRRKLA